MWTSCLVFIWKCTYRLLCISIWCFYISYMAYMQQLQLLINNFPVYYQLYSSLFYNCLEKCCNCIDYYLSVQDGTALNFANEKISVLQTGYIDKIVNNAGQIFSGCVSVFARVMMLIFIIVISMIILCRDMDKIHNAYAKSNFYKYLHKIMHTLKETGLGYLKSQGIIICANWFVCSIAFYGY